MIKIIEFFFIREKLLFSRRSVIFLSEGFWRRFFHFLIDMKCFRRNFSVASFLMFDSGDVRLHKIQSFFLLRWTGCSRFAAGVQLNID